MRKWMMMLLILCDTKPGDAHKLHFLPPT